MAISRRSFLKGAASAGILVSGVSAAGAKPSTEPQADDLPHPKQTKRGEMLYRQLGKTGQEVSVIGMGGFHIGKIPQEEDSISLIRSAIDRGITFLDNCWDYNNGKSEARMGKALRDGYREKVFLMTKIDGRTKDSAASQIEESLKRLQTDRIDLLQHHECIRLDDPDRIFAEGGSMEAFLEAKKAGKIRFIGFTGHKDPAIHLRMLDTARRHDFHFDTVQMPINLMDAHFRSFEQQVLPVALRDGVAVLAMKTFGDPFILKSGTIDPVKALQYSMHLPVSVVITGIDKPQILDQAFTAARTFAPFSKQELASLASRTRDAATNGKFELYKTTPHFDGTMQNPQWLGPLKSG
jgi:predicted aldo/keto reductase-like oxidoreductase